MYVHMKLRMLPCLRRHVRGSISAYVCCACDTCVQDSLRMCTVRMYRAYACRASSSTVAGQVLPVQQIWSKCHCFSTLTCSCDVEEQGTRVNLD